MVLWEFLEMHTNTLFPEKGIYVSSPLAYLFSPLFSLSHR
jgi:hypothetical protein